MNPNNPHEGHRSRLKNRFINEGLYSFSDHNMLELLLFYSIPRKDTNEIAHRLLKEYGSLAAVFDADFHSLIKIPGISENTATLIKLIPQLSRAYLMDKQTRYPDFSDLHKLGTYLVNYYVGETKEKIIAVFLNNRAEMMDLVVLNEGVVNVTAANLRKIVECAIHRNASFVVLAHNHPDGDSRPSDSDYKLTAHCKKVLEDLSILLAEHIVVGGNTYTGILTDKKSGKWYEFFSKDDD